MGRLVVVAMAMAIVRSSCLPVLVYADTETVALIVKAGTPIHVALNDRVTISHVGQIVVFRKNSTRRQLGRLWPDDRR